MGINIKDYLPLVRRPSRYIGGEVNSVVKDLSTVALKFGLGFPDAYEVGMSHLGIQILYQTLNARDDIAAERVFAPWGDMEALLRDKGERLATLESAIALNELDILGFSLQYELSYTNVLNMLDLGSIPLKAAERKDSDPLVIGGGPSCFNPEPMAEFFDAFLLGDGEEAIMEIVDTVIACKADRLDRAATLKRLSGIKGIYVPSLFDVSYNADNTVSEITPLLSGYDCVERRIVTDIDAMAAPVRPVIPFVETIHDRVTVEIARGCTRGCRFCAAGMLYRPARERSGARIIEIIKETLANTGYDEVSLLSLSTGDYTGISELLAKLMGCFARDHIAVSLPSMRVGTLTEKLAAEISKVRKTGFTLAPEAGSERLRHLINKGITEEDLLTGAEEIFSLGWKALKLYFMTGLPTETEADIADIVRLAGAVKRKGRTAKGGRSPQVNVSVATFIPKPFTPFQWCAQVTTDESRGAQRLLRKRLKGQGLGFKWHDPAMSLYEGVFSRGDRRLSAVILKAFESGCRFDGWTECFDPAPWEAAFAAAAIETDFYTVRPRPEAEVFPWDHLRAGVTKEFLYAEYLKALELAQTPDCKVEGCPDCGVCDHKVVKNILAPRSEFEEAHPLSERAGDAGGAESTIQGTVRIRLLFSKGGALRFLGHLELVSLVKRMIRRAGLPVVYSKGFHPMPKLVFSPPLPVGLESDGELLDIDIDAALDTGGAGLDPASVMERLNSVAPEGIRFLEAESISLNSSAPSASINEVGYLIMLTDGPKGLDIDLDDIDGILRDFQTKDSFLLSISKKDKVREVDIRPLVSELRLDGDAGGSAKLRLVLKKADNGPVLRPTDVLVGLLNLSVEDASLIPILKTKTVH